MSIKNWSDFLNGNEKSFSLLYDTYFQGLYTYALRLGFDEETVKDAIHDIFFYIYTSKSKLGHIENIQLYLLISLKNRLFSIYRKQNRKETEILENIKNHEEESDALNNLINQELDKQLKDEVRALVKTLKPKQQQILYYRFALNMKYSEIGTLLNLKPDSVKKTLQRTLVDLRKEKTRLADILRFIVFISSSI